MSAIRLGIANEVETAVSQSQLMLLILVATTLGCHHITKYHVHMYKRDVSQTRLVWLSIKRVAQTMRDSISTPHAHFARPIQYTCGTYEMCPITYEP
jgi:hypothetical protein